MSDDKQYLTLCPKCYHGKVKKLSPVELIRKENGSEEYYRDRCNCPVHGELMLEELEGRKWKGWKADGEINSN